MGKTYKVNEFQGESMQVKLGIMQGRLRPPQNGLFQSFPINEWEFEFSAAQEAGLVAIEWIYDLVGAEFNPLKDDAGIDQIRKASQRTGVAVKSVVADYFMERFLLKGSADDRQHHWQRLKWLMQQSQKLGIERIVLPFVDASKIGSSTEFDAAIHDLQELAPLAEATGVELHLETSLNPDDFATLLSNLKHPKIWANYDSGNSASLGYNIEEEFAAYGERIGSVHIKDRVLNGGTVPLGRGNVNFPSLIKSLGHINYCRDYILQVARGETGDELNWSRQNRQFVEQAFAEHTLEKTANNPTHREGRPL